MTEAPGQGSSLRQRKIPPWLHLEVCRHLATEDLTKAEIARKYGVNRGYITRFSQQYATRVAEIKAHLDDEFAGLWVAKKANRIEFLQLEVERLAEQNGGDVARAKAALLHQVAEELAQLPPRQQVVVTPVIHVLEIEGATEDVLK